MISRQICSGNSVRSSMTAAVGISSAVGVPTLFLMLVLLAGCASVSTSSGTRYEFNARRDNYWREASGKNNPTSYEGFLREYPYGEHTDEAKSRIEQILFARVQNIDIVSVYEDFLSRFPSGVHADAVRAQLEERKRRSSGALGQEIQSTPPRISIVVLREGTEPGLFSKQSLETPYPTLDLDLSSVLRRQGIEVLSSGGVHHLPLLKLLYRETPSALTSAHPPSRQSGGYLQITSAVKCEFFWELCDPSSNVLASGTERFVLAQGADFEQMLMQSRRRILEKVALSLKSYQSVSQ